jgi:hypothetical protein
MGGNVRKRASEAQEGIAQSIKLLEENDPKAVFGKNGYEAPFQRQCRNFLNHGCCCFVIPGLTRGSTGSPP